MSSPAPWVKDADPLPRPQPPRRKAFATVLVLVPVLLSLAVPLYQQTGPQLGGLPFFYWFQMSMAVAAATGTGVAYRMLFRRTRADDETGEA